MDNPTTQQPAGPPIDLKNTTGIKNSKGGSIFQQGVILRTVSKFITGTEEDALKEQEELLARYYDMTYSPEKSGRAKEYIEDSPYYHEGIYDKLEGSLQGYLDSIKPEQKAGGGIIDLYRYGGFVG